MSEQARDVNSLLMVLAADGNCAIDIYKTGSSSFDGAKSHDLKQAAFNIISVCVMGGLNAGGVVTGLGTCIP